MNIRQIAKRANVSVATVSRVLNHPESVAQKTREKIETIIAEEEYTPNWFARGLNLNRTGTIGLMIPHILNSVHMETAKGVEDVAQQKGYVTFMCNAEGSAEKEKQYLEQLIKRSVDGIVLISSTLEEEDLKELKNQNVPVVLVGGCKGNPGLSLVSIDANKGAQMAADHLINVGYSQLGLVSGDGDCIECAEKVQGFQEVMKRRNIPINPYYFVTASNSVEGGYLGAKKLMEKKLRPQALFTTSDVVALGVIDAIHDYGLAIPHDIGVMGFDNIKYGNLIEPKLTTVDVPWHKIGVYGARLLFDLIEEEAKEEAKTILLQTKLKIRKSCGHKERIGEMF